MNSDSNILKSLFSGATETKRLEFKEGFNWEAQESIKLRDELIKAVLAMSNTPSGGSIILGIRTDTKKKKIFQEGVSKKDVQSFIKNDEHIKKKVHDYCQRAIEFEVRTVPHPKNKSKWFVIFQVREFNKWPTITTKQSKTKENNRKTPVIENRAIYTRSKLAQWASIKAGHQEIEDIIEMAVKKYDIHLHDLGYVKTKPKNKEINSWFSNHQSQALKGLKDLKFQAYMEVKIKLINIESEFKKFDLRNAAKESTIPTFGWPIAVFLDNNSECKPIADTNGVKAELPIEKHVLDGSKSYDYWAIHVRGAFYTLKSIFEDTRNPKIISFNTRIIRITEVFMYLKNLYSKLNIDLNKELEVSIKHGGIKGRKLGTLSQNRLMFRTYIAGENEVPTTIKASINDFENDPSGTVEKFTDPLFEAFDFYKLDRKILDEIVQSYLNGKAT